MAEPRIQPSTSIRMTAAEFLQLPETMLPTELIHGELIQSPSQLIPHQRLLSNLISMLNPILPKGLCLFAPVDVYLDDQNVVQPDILWISHTNQRCKIVDDAYFDGSPDLIIEIVSPITARRDKRTKFDLYEQHGVQEYWIADPTYKVVEIWQLVEKKYERVGVFGAIDTFKSPILDADATLNNVFEE